MTKPLVREATPADTPQILHFINELAIYEKLAHEVKTNAAMIQDTLFETDAKAFCLICEIDGQAVGFAIYFFNYSTWLGKYGIYLEDLYVSPEQRGKGAGKALLIHIAKIESCSNAVVESLVSGLPVITNNVGGTKELVRDNGIVLNLDKKILFNEKYFSDYKCDKLILSKGLKKIVKFKRKKNEKLLPKNITKKYYNFFQKILNDENKI